MINIDEVNVALFDFDDTLCIHKYHDDAESERKYNAAVMKDCAWYDNIEAKPNIHMKKFMELLKERGAKLGLISSTVSYVHMQRKQEWVLQKYNMELENYCVGSPDNKVDMLIAIADHFNINRGTVLFIDDCWDNVVKAAKAGFQAASPMEVVNLIVREGNGI